MPSGVYIRTEEYRKIMSLVKKDKKQPNIQLAMIGRKHTEKTKKLIALAMTGRTGSKNGNWKGGQPLTPISFTPEYKQWRTAVFQRDNYTCQWCWKRGCKLEADNIKPQSVFIELRYDINNGRTLCIDCHKKTDTYGHKAKNKKF